MPIGSLLSRRQPKPAFAGAIFLQRAHGLSRNIPTRISGRNKRLRLFWPVNNLARLDQRRVRHRCVPLGGRMQRAAKDDGGQAPQRVMDIASLERKCVGITHGSQGAVIRRAHPAGARRIGSEIGGLVIAGKWLVYAVI